MKDQILETLKPLMDKFADGLAAEWVKLADRSKELDRRESGIVNLREEVKAVKAEVAQQGAIERDKLYKLQEDCVAKGVELDQLKNEADSLVRKTRLREKEIEDNLIAIKADREEALKCVESAKVKEKEYGDKLKSLKADFDKLESREKALNDRETKLKHQESNNLKRQGELDNKALELKTYALTLKRKETEMNEYIKQYKLSQLIGEAK